MAGWRRILPLVVAVSLAAGPAMVSAAAQAKPPRATAGAAATAKPGTRAIRPGLDQIQHIVVIYLENHSFDNLFGNFPGANGLAHAGKAVIQLDKDGDTYKTLPPVLDPSQTPPIPDGRFPLLLSNQPFLIDQYVSQDAKFPSPVHLYYHEIAQIDGGKMDKFVAYADVGALVMGYQDGSKLALWNYAKEYVLADHFFHAAFGGSFLNHFWTICACTPRYGNAPDSIRATLDDKGNFIKDGQVTPDGYAVNTMQPVFQPHSPKITDPTLLLPPQTQKTIGDELSDKNISWAWYSGGWNDALAGKASADFQFHHQPFAYFAKYGDGTEARKKYLRDESDLITDLAKDRLPSVVFWKPIGGLNEHPGYADTASGDKHMAEMVERIRRSKAWSSTVIIVTYDENGGFWDHMPPPKGDRWGPGSRVPTVIISPFAKRHTVDHTLYDTTSILKLIETRYGLPPLGDRDAKANNLTKALDLTVAPRG